VLSRGVVKEIAERIASVLFINAPLPDVALASLLLPLLDFVTRTFGVAPYGVFIGTVTQLRKRRLQVSYLVSPPS